MYFLLEFRLIRCIVPSRGALHAGVVQHSAKSCNSGLQLPPWPDDLDGERPGRLSRSKSRPKRLNQSPFPASWSSFPTATISLYLDHRCGFKSSKNSAALATEPTVPRA